MGRAGLSLSLRALIVIVIGMVLVAILAGSFFERTLPFAKNQKEHANSSTLRACEERVQTYCLNNPDGDWVDSHPDCTEYKDTISDGTTRCD